MDKTNSPTSRELAERLRARMNETANRYAGDGEIDAARALRSMVEPTRGEVMLTPMQYFWWMCAFKYVWRWWAKGGERDIDKAIDCLERLKAETFD